MDVKWVKIRAWHAAYPDVRGVNGHRLTRCGRIALGDLVDDLPAEKSCESCLRIVARKADV
jgi:hypothetical protein